MVSRRDTVLDSFYTCKGCGYTTYSALFFLIHNRGTNPCPTLSSTESSSSTAALTPGASSTEQTDRATSKIRSASPTSKDGGSRSTSSSASRRRASRTAIGLSPESTSTSIPADLNVEGLAALAREVAKDCVCEKDGHEPADECRENPLDRWGLSTPSRSTVRRQMLACLPWWADSKLHAAVYRLVHSQDAHDRTRHAYLYTVRALAVGRCQNACQSCGLHGGKGRDRLEVAVERGEVNVLCERCRSVRNAALLTVQSAGLLRR